MGEGRGEGVEAIDYSQFPSPFMGEGRERVLEIAYQPSFLPSVEAPLMQLIIIAVNTASVRVSTS